MKPLVFFKSLFDNKNFDIYAMVGGSKNKEFKGASETKDSDKKMSEITIENHQKRHNENEEKLLTELPIARQKMLYDIKNGIPFIGYTAKINLFAPHRFENHYAVLQEKLWWKEQGMYLRVSVLPTECCLKFEAVLDEDGRLNEAYEQKNIAKEHFA